MHVIHKSDASVPNPIRIEKFDFYERSRKAYAIVMTGETRLYGCLIIKKGVIK
jgi:L-fucose mutarotase